MRYDMCSDAFDLFSTVFYFCIDGFIGLFQCCVELCRGQVKLSGFSGAGGCQAPENVSRLDRSGLMSSPRKRVQIGSEWAEVNQWFIGKHCQHAGT